MLLSCQVSFNNLHVSSTTTTRLAIAHRGELTVAGKKNYPTKIDGGKDGACLFVYCTYQYHVVPCSTGQSKPRAHSRTIRPSGVWLDWPYTIRVFSVDTQTGWCRGPRPRTGSRCLRSVPGRHGVRRTERTTHGEVEESRLPEVHAIQVTM